MIGLDTNVLLRLFMTDDDEQRDRAEQAVASAIVSGKLWINAIVLSEFAWTLARAFKLPRDRIADLLEAVLSADDLDVEHARSAHTAIVIYRRGRADFPDYFLAEINRSAGCSTTLTFDRKAIDSDTFTAVP